MRTSTSTIVAGSPCTVTSQPSSPFAARRDRPALDLRAEDPLDARQRDDHRVLRQRRMNRQHPARKLRRRRRRTAARHRLRASDRPCSAGCSCGISSPASGAPPSAGTFHSTSNSPGARSVSSRNAGRTSCAVDAQRRTNSRRRWRASVSSLCRLVAVPRLSPARLRPPSTSYRCAQLLEDLAVRRAPALLVEIAHHRRAHFVEAHRRAAPCALRRARGAVRSSTPPARATRPSAAPRAASQTPRPNARDHVVLSRARQTQTRAETDRPTPRRSRLSPTPRAPRVAAASAPAPRFSLLK